MENKTQTVPKKPKKKKFIKKKIKLKGGQANVSNTESGKQPLSKVQEEEPDQEDFPDLQDLMTEEDKSFLKDVDDPEDECDFDVKDDGNEISLSEISGFMKQLNFEKYRPSVGVDEGVAKKVEETLSEKNAGKQAATASEALEVNGSSAEYGAVPPGKKTKQDIKRDKAAIKYLSNTKPRKKLLFRPEDMWREEKLHPLPPGPPDDKLLREAENLAQKLMQDELSVYSKFQENTKRSEARWMKTVLSSGTLSDKMAALTLLVQESPIHNTASLETLVSMAAKKGKREAMMAVDTLKDLYITGLLPDNRKLRLFNQQPLTELESLSEGNIDTRDKLLLMWHFENTLKKKYAEFIKTLGDLSFDTLQASKEKAISTVYQLLAGKPEQESLLLSMLVNKLGDPAIKSKAMYLLTKLVDEHPNMNQVIVNEVQQLLFRSNVSPRAQYYAICFLTQLRLSKTDGNLASQLIKTYFHFFQTYLKSGEVASKMMSALLTGVNRAYAYASTNKEELVDQMDEVYKIIPSVNFHTSVQALMLLYQVIDASTNAADRYYSCLYRKIADPALKTSSKQSIFMNLIFKSLKRDIVDRRIKAFLKRILQVYSQQPPQIICGIMIIISQVLSEKPGLLDVKHVSEGAWSDEEEEEKFVDQPIPEEFQDPKHSENGHGAADKDEEADNKDDNKVNGGKGSWVHRFNTGGAGRSSNYDPFARNPLYSRAELDCVWELGQLAKHYHPTVRLYAETLLKGQSIKYDGDPLKDFTLIRFLDRFVYKNPKKDIGSQSSMSKFKRKGPQGIRAIPVNSKEFLEAGEEGVPVDEKFFFQYFTERAKRRGEDGSDVDSDDDSIKDEEFDAFLDGMEKEDDFGDLDLDFASDKRKTHSTKKEEEVDEGESEEDDDEDDDDDDLDMEDDELAAEFRKEMEGIGEDDSDEEDEQSDGGRGGGTREEDIEFPPDESDELAMMMMGGSKGKKRSKPSRDEDTFLEENPNKKRKKDKHDITNLFASAEEFSHLLEEGTEAGAVSLGGDAEFRNKDKAAQRQLKWEGERDRWLQDKKRGKWHGGGGGKGKGKFGGGSKFGRKGKNNMGQGRGHRKPGRPR